MQIQNLLKISGKAIVLNKVRTFLTMLGVIIGVASVITMLAIGEGSKESIKTQISSMGSNMITIRPGADMMGGVRMNPSDMQTLTIEDYRALLPAKNVTAVSPMVQANGQSIYGSSNWPTSLYGVSPDYLSIKKLLVTDGRMFNEQEVTSFAKVAVLGKTVVENLFSQNENPIGKIIRYNKIPLLVIGVLSEKGENTFGQDQDDVILSPYTTVQKRMLAQTHLQSIIASAESENLAESAVNNISEILRVRHKISNPDDDDFNVFSMEELIKTFSSTSEMLTVLLVAIAGISLLVGGIGIMNIMYVSVKERTREIGLRMAVGAKGIDVLLQFLIESVLISVTGGIIGILLGIASTVGVEKILNWPVKFTVFSILVSFLVCVVTGVFFGWYPAKKAANLDPIQALRYE